MVTPYKSPVHLFWKWGALFLILLFSFSTPAFAQEESDEADPCVQTLDKKVEKQIKKAKELMKEGRTQRQALEIYRDLIEADPTIMEVNYNYAMFFYSNLYRAKFDVPKEHKDYVEALAGFKRLYDICPYYKPMANLFAARTAFFSGNYADAVLYAKAIVENPDLYKNDANIEEAEFLLKKSQFNLFIFDHKRPFDPKPLPGISTQYDEYLATISPDGEQFYFTRRKPDVKQSREFAADETDEKEFFSFSNKMPNGNFAPGDPLPWPFNNSQGEGSPTINLTNDMLIFARVSEEKIGESYYANWDLYVTYYRNGEWSEPQNMGLAINTPNSWESQPSLSSDGNTLYFSSDRVGGFGGSDIWFSERNEDGSWNKAKNMGPVINTKGNERSPFLHSDSKTLYFSSDGKAIALQEDGTTRESVQERGLHLGLGGQDIFYSKLNDKQQWSKPENIGYPINTEDNEVDFFVSLDGKTAYFSSNNLESKDWNIYTFELYEEARPKSVVLLKGDVNVDTEDFSNITVEIRDTSLNIIAKAQVNEETRQYAIITEVDEYNPAPIIVNVKKEGFAFDTRLVVFDLPKGNVVKTQAEVKKVEVGKTFDLHDINFATNSYELTNESKKIILLFKDFLNENPNIRVELQGHTDNVGNAKANQILSENRAKAVFHFLVENGIDASRLTSKGFGASKPRVSNDTEYGRAKNRRTVFVILDM